MKRILTVLAGLTLAFTGTIAFASPASAENCDIIGGGWTSASWGRITGYFSGGTFYGCTQDLATNGHYVYAKGRRASGSWVTITGSQTNITNPNQFSSGGQGCFELVRLYESGTGKYLTYYNGGSYNC